MCTRLLYVHIIITSILANKDIAKKKWQIMRNELR